MKPLYDLCKPRESVFERTKREDVLNLSDLLEGKIPDDFFEENFVTEGMEILFNTAFNRFIGREQTGVIKLTQAMGGGKTHNMIALGLLAQKPELRAKVLKTSSGYESLGSVKVIGFHGRETDIPYGIWGSLAEQLGKKESFKDYYAPLSAPGEKAWINLLSGQPLLILLDELPAYLDNARSKQIGQNTLCDVTSTALANLFSAIGKAELSNVCLVISDLKAAYERGSEIIRASFKNLESEIKRSALNIEPVGVNNDDVYHILKKRLFESLPETEEINQVATEFKNEVSKAKQMKLTNLSPESIYNGIKESFPFHPSIRDLYARFKENDGFQQTRGLIKLMRQVVSGLYKGENCKAKRKYLINVYDFDLNDRDMLTSVTQIKPDLANAIAHDIASEGEAIAEQIDNEYQQENIVSDASKLILVSSLSNIPKALLGLTIYEIVGYLCEPQRDISTIKRSVDEFHLRAWYLDTDNQGKLLFKNVKNLIAELHTLIDSYDDESVRISTLKQFLEEKFKPIIGDCYQERHVFPALDEVKILKDKITLILFEPFPSGSGLHPKLKHFWDNQIYKNRVMFLSGSRNTMDSLYDAAKHLKGIEKIIANMLDEKVPESNQQYQLAQDIRIKKITAVLSAARETFTTLYYPMNEEIRSSDFMMHFKDNNYNAEEQIRSLLKEKQKFTTEPVNETFRRKCEDRLFTRKEMNWSEIKERAATETKWQWHHPEALENLLAYCEGKDFWRRLGDYVEKGPFEKEPTSLAVEIIRIDDETDEAHLRLRPNFGDTVFYEVGAPATSASKKVDNLNSFATNELELSFLCVDSKSLHPQGEAINWTRPISIKHKFIHKEDGVYLMLQSHPKVKIKYTTDGSNPKENGGLYEDEVKIPADSSYVSVVAEYKNNHYDNRTIKVPKDGKVIPEIDKEKPLVLKRSFDQKDTESSHKLLESLKKHVTKIRGITLILTKIEEYQAKKGYVDLMISEQIETDIKIIEDVINNLKHTFLDGQRVNVNFKCSILEFETGQHFLDWLNEMKMSLTEIKQDEIEQ